MKFEIIGDQKTYSEELDYSVRSFDFDQENFSDRFAHMEALSKSEPVHFDFGLHLSKYPLAPQFCFLPLAQPAFV